MKKPSLLILSGLWILVSGFLNAQTQPLTQEELNSQLHLQAQPHFERLPTGEKMFSWLGQSGFSYFIQASPDLLDWTWAPNIEPGVDGPMSYEVDGPTAAGFFRLIRTDQTAADLDAADFDNDGLSNNFELTPRPRPGGITGFANLNPNIQTHPLRADTDGDGLSDKWELENGFDPTDNGSRLIDNGPNGDPDHDSVTNLNEQRLGSRPKGNATTTDSDGDGTLDFEDAVPGDNLVSWKRTPESSYALIEIETTYTNAPPQDLNDKGEVLFPDGIWAGGTWIPKAAPEITGILPGSESEAFPNGIGYEVPSAGWDFFNNDRKLLQNAYVHPTDGPGIDTSAPSPVFWNEGASSPSLVYETANLWDTPYWTGSTVGVSTAGDMIVRASHPGGTTRLDRFNPSGALTGSMDGGDGFHPIGTWGHGAVTGSGWTTSNLARPASTGQPAAHKVGLWDTSNYPIALPAEAEGFIAYPVSLKDLPNGKVVLTAGSDNGTTTTGRVFLPNPTGQYEYATKLADKHIELFAGDGSALTSDNKLWRNGDLTPMADLCSRYKELIEAGNTIHPLRSNNNGTYLVQVQSPNAQTTAALLLRVEFRGYVTKEIDDIVNPPLAENAPEVPTVLEKTRIPRPDSDTDPDDTYDTDFKTEVKTSLKIAQFGAEELFTSDQAGNCTFVHTAFKQDLDIFRVRLPDFPLPAGHQEHRIKIWTTKEDGTTILDPGAEVLLNAIRVNHTDLDHSDKTSRIKFHESAALALVADTEVEATEETDDNFAVEGHGDGELGDRTYRAELGGTVKFKWLTGPGQPEFQIPVTKGRDVHVTGFLMPGGANQAKATRWFERAKEIYSAVGVNLIYDFKTLPSVPTGVNLNNGIALPAEIGAERLIKVEPEMIAVMNVLKDPLYKIAADTIPVFFVTKLIPEEVAVGSSNVPSLMAPGNASYGGAIFIDSSHTKVSVLAHELAHILLDAGHQPSPKALWGNDFKGKKCYVWWGDISQLNGDWTDANISAHRRFRDSMRSRIWKSKYVNPPKP